MYYWICPNCGISIYEDYLECRCGYVATNKDVESSKVKLQDLAKISKEEREEKYLQAVEKKKEEKLLALARQKEQQILEFQKLKEERLKSIEKLKEEKLKFLEKQKEENKKVLQERLSELKELFDTGIITEEEHNRRRQPILDKFFEMSDVNQYEHVKKEEAKKEIKQGYINKNQLTSKQTMSKSTRDEANYFVGSWRGDKSLAVSYWVNGVLLTFALQVLVGLYNSASILFSDTVRLHVRMYFFVAIILEMSVLAVSVWQTVGIWRSAEHHKEKTNRKFIATLAQILICITVFGSYGKIVGLKNYYNDVFWNALGKDPLGEYHLKISDDERTLPGGKETSRVYLNKKQLTISGVISFGLARDVDNVLSANPQIKTVILNSDGGRIWEAENLFDVLTNKGIEETITETGCSSACTIAFLAGKIRLMRNDKPLLGFHSSSSLYYLKNSVDSENRRIQTLMVSLGISSAFANKALSVSPSSMWYPSFDILWDEGIVDKENFKLYIDSGWKFDDFVHGINEESIWRSRKR